MKKHTTDQCTTEEPEMNEAIIPHVDDEEETRDEKFRRVAGKRIGRIMGDLTLLEQMAASSNYDYSVDEVDAMLASIDQRLARVRQRYTLKLTQDKAANVRQSFRFPGKE